MGYRIGLAVVATIAGFSTSAVAKQLPKVQLAPGNQPAQCTTPGRLMAFIKARNPGLKSKFRNIAVEYMRHGRDLGIRWDYAFFQMVVETNSLKFTGDVHPRQNNFAGLGATGGGVKGESFRTVSDGVRAHQQHLMIYAGIRVADPVADRTRKVQSWGILNKWRRKFGRPISYSDVGAKWAPYDRGYSNDMLAIHKAFNASHCNRRDPAPEMMSEALGGSRTAGRSKQPRYNSGNRAGLGASNIGTQARSQAQSKSQANRGYRTLNSKRPSNSRNTNGAATQNRHQKTAAKFATPAIQPTGRKCRVWTASYGGQKATIIRSKADNTINYTVLDVNRGREDAETKAYIAAYAKGGNRIGDYPSKAKAMDKAFKLCPKG